MSTVIWNYPTRILFGDGALADIGAEAKSLSGDRALIVTDPGVVAAGIAGQVEEALHEGGVATQTFDALSTNPTESQAMAATAACKAFKANVVVGVGGGSALDVAKVVRICESHDGPLAQYDDAKGGCDKITQPLLPMIAVPTTAGTGSEVGRSAVVTLEESNRKTVFFTPTLVPNVALLDPRLTVTMPAKTTAHTGFDALTHCLEALCTRMDHPMSHAIAKEGILLVHRYLERAVQQRDDIEARGGMLKASLLGAVAFQKGLGACHSLAHPLSAEAAMHHGLANALCLPAVLDFNRSAVPDKLAIAGKLLGLRMDDEETLAFECSGAVRALRQRLGIANGLGPAGIQKSMLGRLAELAFEDACHLENPRPCTRDDLFKLYEASF